MDGASIYGTKWTRDELIAAFNLYCKIPFARISKNNENIIELARLLGRTPSSVSMKLSNFARRDPELMERGIAGLGHVGKGEDEIWKEFGKNPDALVFLGEEIFAGLKNKTVEESSGIDMETLFPIEGMERDAVTKIRANQSFFRKAALVSYGYKCCVTGIYAGSLLIASHIKPWASDLKNGADPRNGLCLNAFHNRAFDSGLMTITQDYRIKFSEIIKTGKYMDAKVRKKFFADFEGKAIRLPDKFLPGREFIEYHNKFVFIGK
jgi:putative restriction endonuclease